MNETNSINGNGKKEINKLTQGEFFKLCQWLAGKQEVLLENAPTFRELARLYSLESQRPISPGSIARAIDASGVKYSPARLAKISIGKKNRETIELLTKGLQECKAEIAWLRGVVRCLCTDLGFKIKGDISMNRVDECLHNPIACSGKR